ncbi:MAG: hypothetical protein FK733_09560 [Asgard group archaeon]|nr:hypothetical protein [Asgard group archaeon]
MDYLKLVSKKVVDRDGKKIGKVIRIEDHFDSVTSEQVIPDAIIEVSLFLRKAIYPMPIVSPDQFQVIDDTVYLDMSKNEFMQMFKLHEAQRKLKVKAAKMQEVSKTDEAVARKGRSRF